MSNDTRLVDTAIDVNANYRGQETVAENVLVALERDFETVNATGSLGQGQVDLSLQDCVCPICLDFFIDVVETRCQHRFCKFCLENWLRVSYRRQCPTCRQNVGHIQDSPNLQNSIHELIHSEVNEDGLQERNRIQAERQTLLERFASERQQTQSLITRISASRNRARLRDDASVQNEYYSSPEQAANLLSRHIINWWDDSQARENSPVVNSTPTAQDDGDIEDVPGPFWYTYLRSRLRERGVNFRDSPPQPTPLASRNNSRTTSAATGHLSLGLPGANTNRTTGHIASESSNGASMSELEQVVYHDNLMEEYNYHLRRVNSAYNRIREGYRDFNYHNGRMRHIFDEYRSYFGGVPAEMDPTENDLIDYEDYEDLIRAEMGELVDNSPAARVLSGVPPEEALTDGLRPFQNGVRAMFFGVGNRIRNAHNRMATERPLGDLLRSRHDRIFPENNSHPTGVLDMEQEIENRRLQLNGMMSDFRSNNISSRPSRVRTPQVPQTTRNDPVVGLQNLVREIRDQIRTSQQLRSSTAEHRLSVEGLTRSSNSTNSSSAISSRRMRRRGATMNILGQNRQLIDSSNTAQGLRTLSERDQVRTGMQLQSRRQIHVNSHTPPNSESNSHGQDGNRMAPIFASRLFYGGNRRTLSTRRPRRLDIASSSGSESEHTVESFDNYCANLQSINSVTLSSADGLLRPSSAPNESNRRSTRTEHQQPIVTVSSSPQSRTRLMAHNAQNNSQSLDDRGEELATPVMSITTRGDGTIIEVDGIVQNNLNETRSMNRLREAGNDMQNSIEAMEHCLKAICENMDARRPPPEV